MDGGRPDLHAAAGLVGEQLVHAWVWASLPSAHDVDWRLHVCMAHWMKDLLATCCAPGTGVCDNTAQNTLHAARLAI
jgi:hypothetical protein